MLFNNYIDRLPKEIPDNRGPEKVMKVMGEGAECLRITAEIIGDTQMMIKDQRMLLKQIINMEKLVEFMEKSKKGFRMMESEGHPEYKVILLNIKQINNNIKKIINHNEIGKINKSRVEKMNKLDGKLENLLNNI